jgi:hypothetical protein
VRLEFINNLKVRIVFASYHHLIIRRIVVIDRYLKGLEDQVRKARNLLIENGTLSGNTPLERSRVTKEDKAGGYCSGADGLVNPYQE